MIHQCWLEFLHKLLIIFQAHSMEIHNPEIKEATTKNQIDTHTHAKHIQLIQIFHAIILSNNDSSLRTHNCVLIPSSILTSAASCFVFFLSASFDVSFLPLCLWIGYNYFFFFIHLSHVIGKKSDSNSVVSLSLDTLSYSILVHLFFIAS